MRSLDYWGKRTPQRSHTIYNIESDVLETSASAARLSWTYVQALAPEKRPGSRGRWAQREVDGARAGRPSQPVAKDTALIRRPPLPPPRRSYSVMDVEPIPHYHRSSARMTLMDLPAEIHYTIFDFLDPIDSTCLGLTNSHFYAIHRRMRGTVPLSATRDGPNELEWAWRLANLRISPQMMALSALSAGMLSVTSAPASKDAYHETPVQQTTHVPNLVPVAQAVLPTPPLLPLAGTSMAKSLTQLRVRGQAYCRKCGITRCQLHKHIQAWMGEETEYCSVKQKFGPVATEGAKPFCYMSKPGDVNRCGRHRTWGSKAVVHQ